MISNADVENMALSFPETDAHPHFHKTAYRVKKKIFATLDKEKRLLMVRLTPADQSVFCAWNKAIIYPVPGAWGRGGDTFIELKKVPKSICIDALRTAWCKVAPPKLAAAFQS